MSDSLQRSVHFQLGRAMNVLRQVARSDADEFLRLQAVEVLDDIDALYDLKPQGTQLTLGTAGDVNPRLDVA